MTDDLTQEALAPLMVGRALHAYPALMSTEPEAQAWARGDAPAGAVVVATYLAAPRGRAGLPWVVRPDRGFAFSMVLRPVNLPAEWEGWLYSVCALGLADALGEDTTIQWPDEIYRGEGRLGALGLHIELGPDGVDWCVANVLVVDVEPPRGPVLARIVEAIDARLAAPSGSVLADYRSRCHTIGRRVRARLIPLGPGGPQVEGVAKNALPDGAMSIETDKGPRIAVRPQNLGLLDDLEKPPEAQRLMGLGDEGDEGLYRPQSLPPMG